MHDVLELVRKDGGFVLCPGLQPAWYEDKVGTVGFHRDGVTSFDVPIKRYESVKCLLWHKACNRFTTVYDHLYNVCVECKHKAWYTLQNANRSLQVEETLKDARRNPSSNYPVAKLSP